MKKIRTLNKEKILVVAVEILEVDGLINLSMRAIAKKLNVQASAIYNHYKDKQELIVGLQAYYLQADNQKYAIDYAAKTWQDFLMSIATSARLEFTERPHVLELFATHSSDSEESMLRFEKYLATMLSFGFSSLHAAQISQTIYTYIVGYCSFENNIKQTKLSSEPDSQIGVIGKYQLTNSFITEHGWDFERDYTFGVQALIDGFRGYCNAAD